MKAKFDLLRAYHQIPLEEESSPLTQFMYNGHSIQGRFEHTSAPQGLSSSMDIFIEALGQILESVADFVIVEVDDILVCGENIEQLHERIKKLLEACKEGGIQLSCRKAKVGDKMVFAGLLLK